MSKPAIKPNKIMKKATFLVAILVVLVSITVTSFGQKRPVKKTAAPVSKSKPATPKKDRNLLAGAVNGENLPKGWSSGGCVKAAFQSGSIYFELNSPEDVCRLFFTADLPDGKYMLNAGHSIDGNSPEITINTESFGKTNPVESVGGKLEFVIAVGGQGKVWGDFFKMILSKVKVSLNVKVSKKQTIEATDLSKKSAKRFAVK